MAEESDGGAVDHHRGRGQAAPQEEEQEGVIVLCGEEAADTGDEDEADLDDPAGRSSIAEP